MADLRGSHLTNPTREDKVIVTFFSVGLPDPVPRFKSEPAKSMPQATNR